MQVQGAARGGDRAEARRRRPAGRDHDPAHGRRKPELALAIEWVRDVAEATFANASRDRRGRLPGRHDGRDAACRARRRRDRRGGRVLLVRYERPHADDVRVLARRHRGQLHAALPRAQAPRRRTRSRPSTATVSGRWCAPRSPRGARSARTSSSGSAASTAATRPRCTSVTKSGSTTCRARRTACPWPVSRPPTRPWALAGRARRPDSGPGLGVGAGAPESVLAPGLRRNVAAGGLRCARRRCRSADPCCVSVVSHPGLMVAV